MPCLFIFFFQAIKHNKLNTKRNPCEPAKEYKYFDCIMQKTIERLGCKPFWVDMIDRPFFATQKPLPQSSEAWSNILRNSPIGILSFSLEERSQKQKPPFEVEHIKGDFTTVSGRNPYFS